MNAYDGIVWLMNIFVQRKAAWMQLDTWNEVLCAYLLCKRTYVLPTMSPPQPMSKTHLHGKLELYSTITPTLSMMSYDVSSYNFSKTLTCRDHFCLKWYHLSRLSSQWHRQSTSFRHVCHFPPSKLELQDWICFIWQSCGTKQNRSKYQKHQTTEDTDLKPFSLSNLDFMKLYYLHKNVRMKLTRIQFSVGFCK